MQPQAPDWNSDAAQQFMQRFKALAKAYKIPLEVDLDQLKCIFYTAMNARGNELEPAMLLVNKVMFQRGSAVMDYSDERWIEAIREAANGGVAAFTIGQKKYVLPDASAHEMSHLARLFMEQDRDEGNLGYGRNKDVADTLLLG